MQNKAVKPVLLLILLGTMLMNCQINYVEDSEERENPRPGKKDNSRSQIATFKNLFPFEGSANQWYYADADGNSFSIKVSDTISDGEELYFKVAFKEDRLDIMQDNWFLRQGGIINFNPHLQGKFKTFLPASFQKHGGSFRSNSTAVHYRVLDTLTVRGKKFENVLELEYTREMLHGFDRIYFADNIGIIRLVDDDGRWEVDYLLRRFVIGGEETEY